MNARERVMKAWGLMEGDPDRVPVQFDLCKSLLNHFSNELEIPVSITNNLHADVTWRISGNEIRLALGSDVVITGAAEASSFKPGIDENGTWLNEYGMRMRQGSIYVEVTEYPLKDVKTVEDLKNTIVFPDLSLPGRFEDAAALVKKYKDDYFVIGDMEVTIYTLVQEMMGMEKLMIDMALEEEYLPVLIDMVTDFHIEHGLKLMDQGVDALWVGDDFGSQTGLLFSRDMFRNVWKPAYVRMCKAFKDKNPDITLILHCDGAVSELMDDFIEIGFQVFNPVQPGVPGHGPHEMKNGWGNRIGFWGAMDQQELIPLGSDEDLERDVIEKINVLGADGGYVIAPAHILQPDVTPERVKTFIKLCYKHGSIY
jgi:uroporphyrinogen decarboxylase